MKSIQQREKEKTSLEKSEWVYRGHAVDLKLEIYRFDGYTKATEIVQHGNSVVIIPIQEDGKVLLIQQWRRAVGDILIELPAGTLEENEEPLECAKRELQEETGFGSAKMSSLGGFYSAPGFCDEYLHLFIAEKLYPSSLQADDDEMIDLLPVSFKEVKKLIEENKVRDAKTIAGILRYLMVHHA